MVINYEALKSEEKAAFGFTPRYRSFGRSGNLEWR